MIVLNSTEAGRNSDPQALLRDVEALGDKLAAARQAIGRVIFGQQDVIDLSLVTLLAGGHLLLIGVPGLAKTRLVHAMADVLGL